MKHMKKANKKGDGAREKMGNERKHRQQEKKYINFRQMYRQIDFSKAGDEAGKGEGWRRYLHGSHPHHRNQVTLSLIHSQFISFPITHSLNVTQVIC